VGHASALQCLQLQMCMRQSRAILGHCCPPRPRQHGNKRRFPGHEAHLLQSICSQASHSTFCQMHDEQHGRTNLFLRRGGRSAQGQSKLIRCSCARTQLAIIQKCMGSLVTVGLRLALWEYAHQGILGFASGTCCKCQCTPDYGVLSNRKQKEPFTCLSCLCNKFLLHWFYRADHYWATSCSPKHSS